MKFINFFKNYYFIYYITMDENNNIHGYNNTILYNWKFVMLDTIDIEDKILKIQKNNEIKDIKIMNITKL